MRQESENHSILLDINTLPRLVNIHTASTSKAMGEISISGNQYYYHNWRGNEFAS